MLRFTVALAIAAALLGCKKEEDTVTVGYWAKCAGCEITWTLAGSTLGTDSIGGAVVRRDHPGKVGDLATLIARPTVVTGNGAGTGLGIAILVNGRQQGFAHMWPNFQGALDSTISVQVTIPKLDRYGDPE